MTLCTYYIFSATIASEHAMKWQNPIWIMGVLWAPPPTYSNIYLTLLNILYIFYKINGPLLKKIIFCTYRAGSSKSELRKISELRNKWVKNSKNVLLVKLFCFYSDFDENWWGCRFMCTITSPSFFKIGINTKKFY